MKPQNSPITALTCAVILGSAALSQAAVILSENFTYADGALSGQTGGTGFSNAWSSSSTVTSGVVTSATDSTRDFTGNTFGNSGTIWLSFDWGGTTSLTSNNSYGGLTFLQGEQKGFSSATLGNQRRRVSSGV